MKELILLYSPLCDSNVSMRSESATALSYSKMKDNDELMSETMLITLHETEEEQAFNSQITWKFSYISTCVQLLQQQL